MASSHSVVSDVRFTLGYGFTFLLPMVLAILVLSLGGLGPLNFEDGFPSDGSSVGTLLGFSQLVQLQEFGLGVAAVPHYSLGMTGHQQYSFALSVSGGGYRSALLGRSFHPATSVAPSASGQGYCWMSEFTTHFQQGQSSLVALTWMNIALHLAFSSGWIWVLFTCTWLAGRACGWSAFLHTIRYPPSSPPVGSDFSPPLHPASPTPSDFDNLNIAPSTSFQCMLQHLLFFSEVLGKELDYGHRFIGHGRGF